VRRSPALTTRWGTSRDKNALRHLIQNGVIDMIIMAIDYKANPELFEEAIEATQLGISLVPMPLAYERSQYKIPVAHIGEQWYLALPIEVTVSALYLCWHKVMDTLFGLLGMLILGLIFPFMALLIRLDSPGPIFYSQERVGRQGRKFHIRKFRSMYHNAEQPGKAVWATEFDTRITRVGYFLRSTHLDELPQAFTILRGEMSLIGPRPERQEFVSELEKLIPFYRCRLMIKPGLTGWAQVKHHYGNTTDEALEKLQYDLYYIKHQSFTLDILILLRTVAEVVLRRGT
jgi:exopolysaccharide biosynthesis polyprenyl glycosylphosphotransferase